MQQDIFNPKFYEDLVNKFNKIIGNPNFSDLFKRIINRLKRAGYTLGIVRLHLNLGRRFAHSGGCTYAPGSLLATDRSKAVVLV